MTTPYEDHESPYCEDHAIARKILTRTTRTPSCRLRAVSHGFRRMPRAVGRALDCEVASARDILYLAVVA